MLLKETLKTHMVIDGLEWQIERALVCVCLKANVIQNNVSIEVKQHEKNVRGTPNSDRHNTTVQRG